MADDKYHCYQYYRGKHFFFSIHLDVRWSNLVFITYIVFNFFKKLLLYTIIFDKNYFLSYF